MTARQVGQRECGTVHCIHQTPFLGISKLCWHSFNQIKHNRQVPSSIGAYAGINHRLGRCTSLSFLVNLYRFRILDPVCFLCGKSNFVGGFSSNTLTLYAQSATHTAHTYAQHSQAIASIILSIIGGVLPAVLA